MRRAFCLTLCFTAALLACASARAQGYSGTYTTENDRGGTVTLTLRQEAGGEVTGTLSGNGATFHIEAKANQDVVIGMVRGQGGSANFAAQRDGATLHVLVGTRQLVMTRAR